MIFEIPCSKIRSPGPGGGSLYRTDARWRGATRSLLLEAVPRIRGPCRDTNGDHTVVFVKCSHVTKNLIKSYASQCLQVWVFVHNASYPDFSTCWCPSRGPHPVAKVENTCSGKNATVVASAWHRCFPWTLQNNRWSFRQKNS